MANAASYSLIKCKSRGKYHEGKERVRTKVQQALSLFAKTANGAIVDEEKERE